MQKTIMFFDEISIKDSDLVGNKAANLAEIYNGAKISVPNGFVITSAVYNRFPEGEFPREIERSIKDGIRRLKSRNLAVRSSATAEDSPKASFAGQLDTFLNVKPADIFKYVKNCYESMHSERFASYKSRMNISKKVSLGVIIQEMVDAECAGVMFTIDVRTGNKNKVLIEGSWGLGDLVVGGKIIPDRFVLDKSSLKVIERVIGKKTKMLINSASGAKTVSVDEELRDKPILTDYELQTLAEYGMDIEKSLKRHQDIEWAKDRSTQRIYILQSRPETYWSNKK